VEVHRGCEASAAKPRVTAACRDAPSSGALLTPDRSSLGIPDFMTACEDFARLMLVLYADRPCRTFPS
jgi:hypothetical protein